MVEIKKQNVLSQDERYTCPYRNIERETSSDPSGKGTQAPKDADSSYIPHEGETYKVISFKAPLVFESSKLWSPEALQDLPRVSKYSSKDITDDTALLGAIHLSKENFEGGQLSSEGMALAKTLIETALGKKLPKIKLAKEAFELAELVLKKRIRSGLVKLVPADDLREERKDTSEEDESPSYTSPIVWRTVKYKGREVHYQQDLRKLSFKDDTTNFLAKVKDLAETARIVSLSAGFDRAIAQVKQMQEGAKNLHGNALDKMTMAIGSIDGMEGLDSLKNNKNPEYDSFSAENIRATLAGQLKALHKAKLVFESGDAKMAGDIFLKVVNSERFKKMSDRIGLHSTAESAIKFKASVLAVVLSGALSGIAATAITPSLVKLFGISRLGKFGVAAARAVVSASTFVTSNRIFGAAFSGERIYELDKSFWANMGSYGKEVLYTAGMFKVIGSAMKVTEELLARAIYTIAAKKLIAKGAIEAGQIGSDATKELIAKEASKMVVTKTLGKVGIFGFEVSSFQSWEYVKANIEQRVFGKTGIDPKAVFEPRAIAEGGKFLLALKIGGYIARPITMPAQEKVREWVINRFGERLASLQGDINRTLDTLGTMADANKRNSSEVDSALAKLKNSMDRKIQLLEELAKIGAASPQEIAEAKVVRGIYVKALTEMIKKEGQTEPSYRTAEPEMPVPAARQQDQVTKIERGSTPVRSATPQNRPTPEAFEKTVDISRAGEISSKGKSLTIGSKEWLLKGEADANAFITYYRENPETLAHFLNDRGRWGVEAGKFNNGLNELKTLLSNYERLHAEYLRTKDPATRLELERPLMEEISSKRDSLLNSKYNKMEKAYNSAVEQLTGDMTPLDAALATLHVSSRRNKNSSGSESPIFYDIIFTPIKQLPRYMDNNGFRFVPIKELVSIKVSVSTPEQAIQVRQKIEEHGLRINTNHDTVSSETGVVTGKKLAVRLPSGREVTVDINVERFETKAEPVCKEEESSSHYLTALSQFIEQGGGNRSDLQRRIGVEGMKKLGYGTPQLLFGYKSKAEYNSHQIVLMQTLLAAGVPIYDPEVRVLIQGSSVVGRKSGTDIPFRWEADPSRTGKAGEASDIDVAVVVPNKGLAQAYVRRVKSIMKESYKIEADDNLAATAVLKWLNTVKTNERTSAENKAPKSETIKMLEEQIPAIWPGATTSSQTTTSSKGLEWWQYVNPKSGRTERTQNARELEQSLASKKMRLGAVDKTAGDAYGNLKEYTLRSLGRKIQVSIMTPDSSFYPRPEESMVISAEKFMCPCDPAQVPAP